MQPKSSTTDEVTQQPPTMRPVKFSHMDESDHQLQTVEGADLTDGLRLAAELALGVERLCARLDFAANYNDDPVTCVELRALGLLAGTTAALVQAARYGMKAQEEVSK